VRSEEACSSELEPKSHATLPDQNRWWFTLAVVEQLSQLFMPSNWDNCSTMNLKVNHYPKTLTGGRGFSSIHGSIGTNDARTPFTFASGSSFGLDGWDRDLTDNSLEHASSQGTAGGSGTRIHLAHFQNWRERY
jgi:hypothetical protein